MQLTEGIILTPTAQAMWLSTGKIGGVIYSQVRLLAFSQKNQEQGSAQKQAIIRKKVPLL